MANSTLGSRVLSPGVLFAAVLLAAGCGRQNGSAEGPSESAGKRPERPSLEKKKDLPALADLSPGWTRLATGGSTLCADGSPYAFFVRPGTVNRVLLYFRGGGACWSEETCKKAGLFYSASVDDDFLFQDERYAQGIFDQKNARNPFKDWTTVYISYCTGDIHWGDNVVSYGDQSSAPIRHRGARNTRAVLDWLYANVTAPEKVFVTGCSAGAYGAVLWSAHVRQHYEGSKVYQLGDGGAGIITEDFFSKSFPSWNAQAAFPTWIPGLDAKKLTSLDSLYMLIGKYYPSMPVGEYSTKYDQEQNRRYNVMGGGGREEWSQKQKASFKAIEASTPSFRYYLAPGEQHCVIPRSEFYSLDVCGTKVVDWVAARVNDKFVASINTGECAVP